MIIETGDMDMLNDLIAIADSQNAKYPQYAGYFDNYVLVRIKSDVKTKMGLAFSKGELAIASPVTDVIDRGPFEGDRVFIVYSPKNECNTMVRAKFVTMV